MDQRVSSEEAASGEALPPGDVGGARRFVRIALGLGIAAVLIAGLVIYSAHRAAVRLSAATEAQALVTVATTRPEPITAESDLELPGNLQANYEAPIYARTSGYLKRWQVDIGARVKQGQLLAEIESPEVDQQLHQAEAGLATALANQQIADVTAERWKHLLATDSVSKQEADEKLSAAAASDAQVQAARADVSRLRDLAGFERIVAPFDGVITARDTDIGQLINAGSGAGPEMFRIADVSRLRLYVRVPQNYAALMRPGLTAELRFPDRPGSTYLARLETTSDAIDQASRTLMVELIVDNAHRELLPGAYTEVHFHVPPAPGNEAFVLPANVLLFRGDGLHVATVGPQDHVVLKAVTIGRDYGATIEIVAGLDARDEVILSPPDSLAAGTAVRVVKRSSAAEART